VSEVNLPGEVNQIYLPNVDNWLMGVYKCLTSILGQIWCNYQSCCQMSISTIYPYIISKKNYNLQWLSVKCSDLPHTDCLRAMCHLHFKSSPFVSVISVLISTDPYNKLHGVLINSTGFAPNALSILINATPWLVQMSHTESQFF
jgi:hypothetical protein